MNKGWLLITISLFLTAIIWTGFEVYSCFGGLSDKVLGIQIATCGYDNSDIEGLLTYQVTPIPSSLNLETISSIKDSNGYVIIKDKTQL